MKTRNIRVKTSLLSILMITPLIVVPTVGATELTISGNGSGSENAVETEVTTEVEVVQQNNADVENDIAVDASTGENEANDNTGDVFIETGEVAADIAIENDVNNSEVTTECCVGEGQDLLVTDNGEGSQNKIETSFESSTNIEVSQNANIQNNISGYSNTGNNKANDNGGSVNIVSGDVYVNGTVQNIANLSTITAPSGGSNDLSAKVAENGTDSENDISVKLAYNTNVTTFYDSNIFNDIEWDLNTGDNEANGNLGDVSFLTGDIFFEFAIINGPINIGGIDIGCCAIYDPGDGDPEDEDDRDNGGDPGSGGNDGGDDGSSGDSGNDSSDDGGDDGGTLLASAAATELLGLSDTSSTEQRVRAFWIGLVLISLGIKLLGDELRRYNGLQLNEAKK